MGIINFDDWDNNHIPEILQEIYLQRIYFPYLNGKRNAILFDIGSNLSLWSLYASQFAKQIYAFEPALEIYKIGKKNLDDNKITNVKLFQKAIAPADGKTIFYHSSNKTMFSMNPLVNDNKEKEEVETMRLDTLVKEEKIEHIDFIKLDVEGTEDKIFTSDSFINIVPILDCFIYEWHSWAGTNPNLINAGLKELGFNTKQIPSNATIFVAKKV